MKRGIILILCISLIIFNAVFLTYNKPDEFTINTLAFLSSSLWKSIAVIGHVLITLGGLPEITIYSPENITYNFSIGDIYTLDLNVSANFNASTWRYTLLDLKHNSIVYDNVAFNPNSTFNAARWSNKIIVRANNPDGETLEKNITFFIYVPNSAPIIDSMANEMYVCEKSYFSYFFNATDADEDVLSYDISLKDPFYIFLYSFPAANKTTFEITSGTLTKNNAGGINSGYKLYQETVSVSDGSYPDSKNINITIIEINNAPVVGNIGVQTIWLSGENNSFYKQVTVSDVEDGNQSSGNLIFNISFASGINLFNISNNGIINFTSNGSDTGVYNISLCVIDMGIANPHPNISLCNQTGDSIEVCQNFSLTITNENRQPTITSYYPSSLSFNVSGTDALYFNITSYDADGTIPDIYWYADNALKLYQSGSLFSEFTYSFGCDVSGNHGIKAEITDGLLNDSVEWNVSVNFVACPVPPAVVGGGGGGGRGCNVKWVCDEWQLCQNAEKSLKAGLLSGEDYRNIKDSCSKENLEEKACGLQIRNCFDINFCNLTINKPQEIQFCHYTEYPSCSDGIKNCHDNPILCEFLVDCGGPCPACPTCSDKIRNQDEEDIDCGGPCPACPVEKPLAKGIPLLYILMGIIISILVIAIIIRITRIISLKRRMKKKIVL